MSVSFYNNERSREGEDLDCLETIAELTLRILFTMMRAIKITVK